MKWQHVSACALGASLAVIGALSGTIEVLAPIASLLIGGALGNATAETSTRRRREDTPTEPDLPRGRDNDRRK